LVRWGSEISGAATCLGALITGLLVLVSFDIGLPGQALLQSLRFHIAAGMLAAILLLLVTRSGWRALAFGLVMLASAGEGGLLIQRLQATRAAEHPPAPLFSLLSFNVLTQNPRPAELAQFIAGSSADVVFILEGTALFPYLDDIAQTYPHQGGCTSGESCGLLMLSRTPLEEVEQGDLGFIFQDRLLTARTEIGGQRVALVAVHLVKPYFDDAALGEAFRLRQRLAEIEGPLVLAGDFNSAAWADNIVRLIERADLTVGPSFPATWPVRLGPLGVPIDHVFTRSGLVIEALSALPDAMGSNHRGLLAEIALRQ
jgi:endonuclease/exonuclease/phosphatase (EEP) superfamily protein YafD